MTTKNDEWHIKQIRETHILPVEWESRYETKENGS